MSICKSFAVFPENRLLRNAVTRSSGHSSFSGHVLFHDTLLGCMVPPKPELPGVTVQLRMKHLKYSPIGMTDSSPSEWETTEINGELHLHTHTYTRASMNKLFMKKPTYFHASHSGSSQTIFLFPLFQVPWFIFLTNHFPNYKLLFIKWSSAQMMSVLISRRLDHHTKGNCTRHWGRPWPPGASFSLDQRSLKLWPQGWMVLGWLKCVTCIVHFISIIIPWGLPGDSDSKKPACNAGDRGLIPGSGISPGEGNGNPLQYSCLESSMDRGALQATVHGVEKIRTLLSN